MYSVRAIIKNGRIFTGREFITGDVAFTEDKIAAVGDCSGFEADDVFDASGCIVAPGLVDIHTHLRCLSSPEYETDGEAVCFPNGVTAACEAGASQLSRYCDYTPLTVRLFASSVIKNGKAFLDRTADILDYYGERAIGVKAVFDKGQIGECGLEPLREICDFARERGLRVMVHCTDSPVPMAKLLSCLQKGDICTHIYHGVGNTSADDGFSCLAEARSRGVILDAGLAGGVHTDFEIAREAIKKNILPDTVSTDITCLSAFRRGGNYGLTFAMSMMKLFGMPEDELLSSVTSRAADAIGLSATHGLLAAGRPADICVLKTVDTDINITDRKGHTLASSSGYRCMMTVCGGRFVYRDGAF